MAKILPISERGQFTIPKKIREKFENPYVICEERGDRVFFRIVSPEISINDKQLVKESKCLVK